MKRVAFSFFAIMMATPAIAAVQPAPDASLPKGVAEMIEAAIASGDEATLRTVVALAKQTNPKAVAAIDTLVGRLRPNRSLAAFEAVVSAVEVPDITPPIDWKGRGEAGASHSTGNTDSVGVTLGLELKREGPQWRHRFAANVDYQKADGAISRDRYAAEYQANLKFGSRYYVTGGLQWERDRLLGHRHRFIESAGLGWRAVESETFRVDLDGGPALRQTNYIDGEDESTILGRASLTTQWKLSDTTVFNSSASAYLDSGNDSFSTTTALTAKLLGPLSTRVSFNLWHETDPPVGAARTNTASRVTFVYSF